MNICPCWRAAWRGSQILCKSVSQTSKVYMTCSAGPPPGIMPPCSIVPVKIQATLMMLPATMPSCIIRQKVCGTCPTTDPCICLTGAVPSLLVGRSHTSSGRLSIVGATTFTAYRSLVLSGSGTQGIRKNGWRGRGRIW